LFQDLLDRRPVEEAAIHESVCHALIVESGGVLQGSGGGVPRALIDPNPL
jgi:hypothetical protein